MKKRFALSSAGLASLAVSGGSVAEIIKVTFHYHYWVGDNSWKISDASGNTMASMYVQSDVVLHGSAVVSSSFGLWNESATAYDSGYRHEITLDLAIGDYTVEMWETYGSCGWCWGNVDGTDAFTGCGTTIPFSNPTSASGTFTVELVDCNMNGVSDAAEISDGSTDDCDNNYIPDICEYGLNEFRSFEGIPTNTDPFLTETIDFPASIDDFISVEIMATGAFNSPAAFLFCYLDEQLIGLAFGKEGSDCDNQSMIFNIPLSTWNTAAEDGSRNLRLTASPATDPTTCPANQVDVRFFYGADMPDCNMNSIWDICDITSASSTDHDGNQVPDECQEDCDLDGYPDGWAVDEGLVLDCNGNQIPDSCDIASGLSSDVDLNGVPDECKSDCNGNGLPDAYEIANDLVRDCNMNGQPDSCDIADETSADDNGDGIPDECAVDCNDNGLPDAFEIATGLEQDCNENFRPDSCDIADEASADIDEDGIPDECEEDCNSTGLPDDYEISMGLVDDCNGNDRPDTCDIDDGLATDCDNDDLIDECAIMDGVVADCNENDIPDSCDVDINGEEDDINENGIPDSCELAQGDLNLDGCIDGADLGILFSLWGLSNPPIGDLNGDGTVDAADLGLMLGYWRSCP